MKAFALVLTVLLLAQQVFAFGTNCHAYDNAKANFPNPSIMPQNLKVVFLGDSGSSTPQREVLTMIKDWEADFVIHSGDFDYEDDPALFEKQISDVLGANYPYFASIGNHDEDAWDGTNGYAARLNARLQRSGAASSCTGEVGVNMACYYKGLYFILSGVGTQGSNHVNYVNDAFSSVPAIWKVVSWHKNQRLMQVGGKSDETGWSIYDTSRAWGAIIATGHEHSYSRTYLMSDFQRQVVASTNATLNLSPGKSFAFVSGLGGNSIRSYQDNLEQNPWWAATAASDDGVSDGALFCTFNIDNNPRKANCFFKDRRGRTWDDFDIITDNPETTATRASISNCPMPFYDIAIDASEDDAQEDLVTGTVITHSPLLSLGNSRRERPSIVALRFNNIPLSADARIKTANLQFFGAKSDQAFVPALGIRGERVANAAQLSQSKGNISARSPTNVAVTWQHEDEGFETHTVWVSPNIKDILNEIIALPGWKQGNSIVLTVEGLAELMVSSFDRSKCLAPSLIIELEADC